MRVLGIDPGSHRTGWGLVERHGNRLSGVAADVLVLGSSRPLPDRLRNLFDGLTEVVRTHRPDVVAIEDIFFAKHASAALKLGHARGVALLVAANAALPIEAYPPALVKRTVAGRGGAEKEQVAELVCKLLGLTTRPGLDACDALAIAVTHVQAEGVIRRIADAKEASRPRSCYRRRT